MKTLALGLFLIVMISMSLPSSSSTISGAVFTDQKQWSWSYTEVISDNGEMDSFSPDLAVDDLGNVHVVWAGENDFSRTGMNFDILYRRWDVSTQSWGDFEIVYDTEGGASNPQVLIDNVGNVHVTWQDDSDYDGVGTDDDIFYRMRDESTGLWGDIEVVTRESANTDVSRRPRFVVDANNDIHLVWDDWTPNLANSGADLDVFYKQRFSRNNSWSPMMVISSRSNGSSQHSQIAVDSEGTIHFAWDDFTSTFGGNDRDILYRKYVPGLNYWSGVTVVSSESTNDAFIPFLITDAASNVHVTWTDSTDMLNSGPDWDVFYRKYDHSQGIWKNTTLVSDGFIDAGFGAEIAVDDRNNPSIVWSQGGSNDYFGSGDDEDIVYRQYDAVSDSWSTMHVVSTESNQRSTLPALSIDRSGFVHVAWYDYTSYQNAGFDSDIFYKKFHGLPAVPTLEAISPNPSTNGIIQLHWNEVYGAINYLIYRNQTPITSVSELDPIAMVTENKFVDYINTNEQHFYYAVSAENYDGLSQISNSEYVQVLVLNGNFGTNATDGFPNQTAFFDGSLPVTVMSIVIFLAVSAFRKRKIRLRTSQGSKTRRPVKC
ncbi:MAG: hypothetical protein ACFFE8_02070 [Candidatus Heimdallarchaeota archaeon]